MSSSSTMSASSGKPKAFATLMGNGPDGAASATITQKKQSSKKGISI